MPNLYYDENLKMDVLEITWEERLDDLYSMVESDADTAESVTSQWWDWVRFKYGQHVKVEVEDIPDYEWRKFEEYVGESEDDND